MSRLTALPFGYYASRRRDNRAVSQLVALMSLDPRTGLGLELRNALRARVSDCRDLFAQRGVCPRRASVLRLAARSIRDGQGLALQSDVLAPLRAQALWHAAGALLDRIGRVGYEACVRDAAAITPPASVPAVQAAVAPLRTTDCQIAALRAIRGLTHLDNRPPVLDPRFIPANSEASTALGQITRLAA